MGPGKTVLAIEHPSEQKKGQSLLSSEPSCMAVKPVDHVVVEAGQIIPGDGEIIEGFARIDESAITGESLPVNREAGRGGSIVTGGTLVLSDRIVVLITAARGESFRDRMIVLAKTMLATLRRLHYA
jgi:K+-transporting ATPase ATPase B chain